MPPPLRLRLELRHDEGGRIAGTVAPDGAHAPVAFCGTLELLAVLEDLLAAGARPPGPGPRLRVGPDPFR
jgi:hypothetical protein